jgi:hypothetical protein
MITSYIPLPPSAFMACSGTALPYFLFGSKRNGNYSSPVIVSGNNGSELVSRSSIIQYFILQSRYIMLMLMYVLMNCVLDM